MSEKRDDAPMEPERGSSQVKLLVGRILSVVGLLIAIAGMVTLFLGASGGSSADISDGAIALILGVAGYFLGATRLGLAAVVVGVVVIVLSLAVTQGIIPGLEPSDRSLPQRETGTE